MELCLCLRSGRELSFFDIGRAVFVSRGGGGERLKRIIGLDDLRESDRLLELKTSRAYKEERSSLS